MSFIWDLYSVNNVSDITQSTTAEIQQSSLEAICRKKYIIEDKQGTDLSVIDWWGPAYCEMGYEALGRNGQFISFGHTPWPVVIC